MRHSLTILLILVLIITGLVFSQDIKLSKAEVTNDNGLIVVHYVSNVPCRMYVRYCSDYTCDMYEAQYGMDHYAVFVADHNETYFDAELIFVRFTGKILIQEFQLRQLAASYVQNVWLDSEG